METYWISYTGPNQKFWSHEYNTHGSCYINKYNIEDPREFFSFSIGLFKKYELDLFMQKAIHHISEGEQSYRTAELIEAFSAVANSLNLKFDIECKFKNSKQYIQEIRFYFDLDLMPVEPVNFKTNCVMEKPTHVIFG